MVHMPSKRYYIYQGLFFWIFMASLLMFIDWKNGLHNFEFHIVLKYYSLWLAGAILYVALNYLLLRWQANRKRTANESDNPQ
jgi:hypothetical protein